MCAPSWDPCRSLDDATYATLSSLVLFNNVEVVTQLAQDPDFLARLFQELSRAQPADSSWGDLVAFLQEFCSLSKHLPPNQRGLLFSKLAAQGLFEQVTTIMDVGSDMLRLRATDILVSVVHHNTGALRTFLRTQPDHRLLGLLVRELGAVQGPAAAAGTASGSGSAMDNGLPEQVVEILKTLLDPESLDAAPENDEFCDVFYDKFFPKLLDVLTSDCTVSPKEGTRDVPATSLSLIVDIMGFLVAHHGMRFKYTALRAHTIPKVAGCIRRREQWVQCAAIRFLKTMVSLKDEFYARHLLKTNALEAVMAAFLDNGDRYNLLNSTTLELVDFIRRENIKPLIDYLVTHYGHRFEDIDYVDTFKVLKIKYEQNHEGANGGGAADGEGGAAGGRAEEGQAGFRGRFSFGPGGEPQGLSVGGRLVPQRRRRDERGLDRDEEVRGGEGLLLSTDSACMGMCTPLLAPGPLAHAGCRETSSL